MADNTGLNSGTGGNTIRDIDKAGIHTQVVAIDLGGSGAESLLTGTLPVSVASLPLPAGASTSALQTSGNASLTSIDGKVPALGQALAAGSVPIVMTAAQLTTLTPPAAITGFATEATLSTLNGKVTAVNTGAVVISSSALPTGAATETTLGTRLSESDFDTKTGSLTESAPATDTASSGLNGRLQRIAQRITSLITALGSPFQAGGSIGNTAFIANAGTNLNTSLLALDSTVAKDASLTTLNTSVNTLLKPASTLAAVTTVGAVTAITNALPTGANVIGGVTQSGTWTVQPGNTANTTAWLVAGATLTKATQGATGFSVQDLKDAGRSARNILLDSFAVAAITETLNTMSYSTDNGTLTTGTSYTVTTAKRLRIQAVSVGLHTITGNTTAVTVIVRIRVNNAGAATVTSPVQMVIPLAGIAAANQNADTVVIAIPGGWEFVAGAGIGVTTTCAGFVATTAAPKVDISIIGYEY